MAGAGAAGAAGAAGFFGGAGAGCCARANEAEATANAIVRAAVLAMAPSVWFVRRAGADALR